MQQADSQLPDSQLPDSQNNEQEKLQNRREWLANPWLLAIFAVIGVGAFYWQSSLETLIAPHESAKEFPMIYMTGVNVREFGPSGELTHQITSDKIVQYQMNLEAASPNDYFLFTKPIFTFYENQPTPWQVSSESARGVAGGNLMTLSNNVVIQQDSVEHGLITAKTEELLINTKAQTAETDKPVNMRNNRMTIDAIGMQANLQDNNVLMKSNVKVFYAPQ